MSADQWVIPPPTLRWLEQVHRDRPVVMLIRHSVREALPPGDAAYVLPITEEGHRLSVQLGGLLGERLRSVHASPLTRTMQTASALAAGAGLQAEPRRDHLLGDPGAFVVDDRAGRAWDTMGHEAVMQHLVSSREPLPGLAEPESAARFLAHHMLSRCRGVPGVHAFVTHDSLITAMVSWLVGEALTPASWPWYLEAVLLWEEEDCIHVAYRDHHVIRKAPLVGLSEADVIGFARREVAATVGLDCRARFFVAGGAFKSLLTGQPPRDLDLWAPSEADRQGLVATLLKRGAVPLPTQPYTQGFRLRGRTIEIPHKTEPDTLEARLLHFDIALSAVGAEFCPGDQWRASIHPRARASVEQRRVLLLPELPNWRHSLASLERMRRYAEELGYTVPSAEEDRIWRIFEQQTREQQEGMLTRFQAVTRDDQGVMEELRIRCSTLGLSTNLLSLLHPPAGVRGS